MPVAPRLALAALLAAVAAPARADFVTFSFEPENLISGDRFLSTPTTFRPTVGDPATTLTISPTSSNNWFVTLPVVGIANSQLIGRGPGFGVSFGFSQPVSRLLVDFGISGNAPTVGLQIYNNSVGGSRFFPAGPGRNGVADFVTSGSSLFIEGLDGPPGSLDARPSSETRVRSISAEVAAAPPAVPAPPAVLLAGLGAAALAARRLLTRRRA